MRASTGQLEQVTRKTAIYLLTGKRRKLPDNAVKHLKYTQNWGCRGGSRMGIWALYKLWIIVKSQYARKYQQNAQ